MDKTLKERCEQVYKLICEYYNLNKYYLTETAKDALLNALDCMEMIAGERSCLPLTFSGCDSHLPILVGLANNSDFTDQMKEAFHTAYEALIEIFVHRKRDGVIHAHWTRVVERDSYFGFDDNEVYYKCSNCNTRSPGTTKYCLECGATMDMKEQI